MKIINVSILFIKYPHLHPGCLPTIFRKWKYSKTGDETGEFIFKKKNVVAFRKVTKTSGLNKSVSDTEGKAFVDPEASTWEP